MYYTDNTEITAKLYIMSNRDNRAKIAQDTLGILNRGFYQNKLGEIVDISESLKAAKLVQFITHQKCYKEKIAYQHKRLKKPPFLSVLKLRYMLRVG
jgi:hypothetical protein